MTDGTKGAIAMVVACTIWGLSPLFYAQLTMIAPLEVLAYRSLWSLVFFAGILIFQGRIGLVFKALGSPRQFAVIALAALGIAGNWFGFIFAIEKTKNSAAGVPVLLAFTFFMGLMLSRMIAMVLGFKNGAELIMTAFGGTAGVFFLMASLSTVIKRDLSGMGKWLFVGAIVLMVGSIINVFVGSSAGMMAISMLAIGIFSAYMLYDLKQILDGGETNYISATLMLYMDLFNVFQSLLALLGLWGGERD